MNDDQKESLLRAYVDAAKVMQLATLGPDGPHVCHVWYAIHWPSNRLLFTSSTARNHSVHIAANPAVGGGILDMDLKALGQKVRGVAFTGMARVVPDNDLDDSLRTFLLRWPKAGLDAAKIRRNEVPHRLYEVQVSRWILHDEVNLTDGPRFELPVGR